MKYIVKRDKRKAQFNYKKIFSALDMAINACNVFLKEEEVDQIKSRIVEQIANLNNQEEIEVEKVQDIVVSVLVALRYQKLANCYEAYRIERNKSRESKSDLMKTIKKIGIETDRDNANVGNNFSSKLLRIASETNKRFVLIDLLPEEIARAHEIHDIYIHDLDSYNLTINCLHIPTKKMLASGFNTGYGTTNSPRSIETAAALACILMQSSQNDMFGGQSHPNFDNDMAPYVVITKNKIYDELKSIGLSGEQLEKMTMKILLRRVRQAMQSVVYNLNTMHSRAGSQVPFSSLNIGIPQSEEAAIVCQAFLEEYYKGMGDGEQPIFPNIIFRVKEGINREPNDPYYYLFQLACHVASVRMNPTFMNIDADFNKYYYDQGILPATMGCRTYLCSNRNGEPGVEGRGNNAPVTINLVRLGIRAKNNIDKFFELFDEKINLCVRQLQHRYSIVKKLKVKDLPFVVGQELMRGSENLKPNDSIEPVLKNGTWGIGFIGLAETLKVLTGKHHGESKESQELGLRIVKHLRKRTDEIGAELGWNLSTYATPAEGLSGKFTEIDKRMYGEIDWITDKGYYTNSFHVPVDFPISIAEKIKIEAPYHALCNAGHISYIEFDDYPTGEQVEKIIRYAYTKTNMNYMGINFHIRYCVDCAKRHAEEAKQEHNHDEERIKLHTKEKVVMAKQTCDK